MVHLMYSTVTKDRVTVFLEKMDALALPRWHSLRMPALIAWRRDITDITDDITMM